MFHTVYFHLPKVKGTVLSIKIKIYQSPQSTYCVWEINNKINRDTVNGILQSQPIAMGVWNV